MRRARLLTAATAFTLLLGALLVWRPRDAPLTSPTSPTPATPPARTGPASAPTAANPFPPGSTSEPTPDLDRTPLAPGGAEAPASSRRDDRPGRTADSPSPGEPDREPSFERVRQSLADSIETHLPELEPSERELDALAEAALRLRRAQQSLRGLAKERAGAARRSEAHAQLEQATRDFSRLAGMTPGEFSRRVRPDGGIDTFDPNAPPEAISIRPIVVAEEPE